MKLLYIADADIDSQSAGSVRGRAIKNFLELNYDLTYLSLSEAPSSNAKYSNKKVHLSIGCLQAFKSMGFNRSFRSIDSSIFRKSFYANIIQIIKTRSIKKKYNLIYCSYKPSSAIWLGIFAKIYTKSILIVEYRDLMSPFGDRDLSSIQRRLLSWIDHHIELFLLKFVNNIIVVSDTQHAEFKSAFGRECVVVMNGIDGELVSIEHSYNDYLSDRTVNIGYAGQLSKRRRLSSLCFVDGKYTLQLMSRESPYDYGLPRDIECTEHGFLEEKQMNAILNSCDCFLLIEGIGNSSKGNIPSKVFQYIKFGKPILFYGNPESDVATILRNAGLLIIIPNEGQSINLVAELKRVSQAFDRNKLSEFTRSNQLKRLKEVFDEYII